MNSYWGRHLANEGLTNDYFFYHCAVVPNPAVFWSRLRNRDGISDPIFSPEITLLTLSGVVKPLRSIKMPFNFSYLCVRKGWSNTSLTSVATSPESAAQVNLYRSSLSVIWCKSNCVLIWLNHNSTIFKKSALSLLNSASVTSDAFSSLIGECESLWQAPFFRGVLTQNLHCHLWWPSWNVYIEII